MQERKKPSIPPVLIVLSMIGNIVIGLGLAKYFSKVDVIHVSLRFANYELVFIGAGAALATPLMIHLLGKVISASKPRNHENSP